MINILLLILKIIGITILCVIGLVILILLIVSWVPIRYGADFSKYEKTDLRVYVTWFLKAVSFEFFLKEGGTGTRLRLFGKALGAGKKKTEQPPEPEGSDKREEPVQEAPEDAEAETGTPEMTEEEVTTEIPTEEPQAEASQENSGTPEEAPEKPPDAPPHQKEEGSGEDTENVKEEDVSQEEEEEQLPLDEKLDGLLAGFLDKYVALEDKWEGIRDKYEFLTGTHAMREYGRVFRNIGKIIRHILPHHLTGRLHYGLDAPDVTGKILAYYCALAPVHKYALIPEPDFTQKVIEGEAHLTGRIFIGYIILKALGIALNRDVIYLLFNFRKQFRKSQEGQNVTE